MDASLPEPKLTATAPLTFDEPNVLASNSRLLSLRSLSLRLLDIRRLLHIEPSFLGGRSLSDASVLDVPGVSREFVRNKPVRKDDLLL